MKLGTALAQARSAARANLLPGLVLQAFMVIFLTAYLQSDHVRHVLAQIAIWKREAGFFFAFFCYVFSAALLPEVLRVLIFQGGKSTRRNLHNFLTAAPGWGGIGILVDVFYRCQALWFGEGHTWPTLLAKMAVDQFLFSPFLCTPLTIAYFLWRDHRWDVSVLRRVFSVSFVVDSVVPVQVAGWCIWIPGVLLVYFMPSPLQIPVAVMIQTFWVLVFTMVDQRNQPHA